MPKTASWTARGYRRWFARCDVCRQRRLVGCYYECYGQKGEGWWYSCSDCLMEAIAQMLSGISRLALDVIEADQCWHQWAYEQGDYDGDYHAEECLEELRCGDPCRLCLMREAIQVKTFEDGISTMGLTFKELGAGEIAFLEERLERIRRTIADARDPLDHYQNVLVDTPEKAAEVARTMMDNMRGQLQFCEHGWGRTDCLACGYTDWNDTFGEIAALIEEVKPVKIYWDHAGGHPYENTLVADWNDLPLYSAIEWAALPPSCTEHGLENCPCEEGEHPHTHNGMGYCYDYEHCQGCHCHLQDERHTACCLGTTARRMYQEHVLRQTAELGKSMAEQFLSVMTWLNGESVPHLDGTVEPTPDDGGLTYEHNTPDFGVPMCYACVMELERGLADRKAGRMHPLSEVIDEADAAPAKAVEVEVWIGGIYAGRAINVEIVSVPVETPEVVIREVATTVGQALRHGAPCFNTSRYAAHVIGTGITCTSCVSYRRHAGLIYEQALELASTWSRADPLHTCPACAWGRPPEKLNPCGACDVGEDHIREPYKAISRRLLCRPSLTHVVGTALECDACKRYRSHLGITHDQVIDLVRRPGE